MSDSIEKIKELTEKQRKAQIAATKVSTQIESYQEEITRLEQSLSEEFDITFDEAAELLNKLKHEEQELLERAEEVLGGINL